MSVTISNLHELAKKSGPGFWIIAKNDLNDMGVVASGFDKYFSNLLLEKQTDGDYFMQFTGKPGVISKDMCISILSNDFGQDCFYDSGSAAADTYGYKEKVSDIITICENVEDNFFIDINWGKNSCN